MARPKGFEPDAALEKAITLFREKGYEAASMQEMVAATGLNCSSLYNTFGDKHTLFLAALELYITRQREEIVELLEPPTLRLSAVRTLLENIADRIAAEQGSCCLVAGTATELAERDEDVARIIRGQFNWMEETFRQLFAEAQRTGELNPARDTRALSRFLNSSILGLVVTGTTNRNRKVLQDIIDTTMIALR